MEFKFEPSLGLFAAVIGLTVWIIPDINGFLAITFTIAIYLLFSEFSTHISSEQVFLKILLILRLIFACWACTMFLQQYTSSFIEIEGATVIDEAAINIKDAKETGRLPSVKTAAIPAPKSLSAPTSYLFKYFDTAQYYAVPTKDILMQVKSHIFKPIEQTLLAFGVAILIFGLLVRLTSVIVDVLSKKE